MIFWWHTDLNMVHVSYDVVSSVYFKDGRVLNVKLNVSDIVSQTHIGVEFGPLSTDQQII